jgi:hypothetical protein
VLGTDDALLALSLDDEELELESVGVGRLSVTYQPLPLKTIPTGCSTRRSAPPQPSWLVRGESEKLCLTSMRPWQLAQAYSYSGTFGSASGGTCLSGRMVRLYQINVGAPSDFRKITAT